MTENLKDYYNKVYAKDITDHFLKYRSGDPLSEAHKLAKQWLIDNEFDAKNILDFGCGEGHFLDSLKKFERKVGVDYSHKAIENAKAKFPNLDLVYGSQERLDDFQEQMDVVTSFGTLEHVDNPQKTFEALTGALKSEGTLIVSCPSFTNVRGVIWMTLSTLFNIPMSLSDKHFLSMHDFKIFAKKAGVKLIHFYSVDVEVSQGVDFENDMRQRLTNALRDAGMDNSHVDELLQWVNENMSYFAKNEYSGAETAYVFRKR